MTKRLCTRCGRYFPDTLKTCPDCGPPWWRLQIKIPAFGAIVAVAGLWSLYCFLDASITLARAPQILRQRMGNTLDDPQLYALAMDSFTGAFLTARLQWWFAITVVLLLIALIIKRNRPPDS